MDTNNKGRYIPYVTYALAGVNVLIFLIETIFGGSENIEVALRFGAMYLPRVLEKGEFYRLFCAMFLHFGFEHILMNMVALIAMGTIAEEYLGRVNFIILYLTAGIGGNVLSFAYDLLTGRYAVSAGASGAISGVLAVFVFLAIDERTRKMFPLTRVLAGIVFVMLPGFRTEGIDVMAHLGGFVTGLVTALIMFAIKRSGKVV